MRVIPRSLLVATCCALLCVIATPRAQAQRSSPSNSGSAASATTASSSAPADADDAGPDESGEDTALSPTPSTGRSEATPAIAPFPTGRVIDVRLDPPLAGQDPWLIVGLRRGDVLDRLTARGALRAALASGTFAEARASVTAIPGGLQLLIEGERRFRVREVAFLGVQTRPLDAARSEFGIRGGEWVTESDVDRAVEALHGAYASNGWAEATVTVRWRETDDPATRLLIVEVGEGRPTLVRRVVFEGIPADMLETVRGVLGISVGDTANPQIARRAMDPLGIELRRAGYFTVVLSPIRYQPAGPHLVDVFVAARTGPRYRIRWQGVDPYPETAVEAALRIEEERGLDPTTLNVFVGRAREFFVRRGYLDAQVRIEIRPETPERAELRIVVDRGPLVQVRDVSFPGASQIQPGALRSVLDELLDNELPYGEYRIERQPNEGDLAGGGSFLWVRPSRTYVPELYVEASRRMVNRYREAGFLEPIIAAPHVERVRLADGSVVLDIAFAVTEGPRAFLDEVTFEGNDSIPSRTLADQIRLRLGVPLSSAAREEARTALQDFYHERGYMFARVDPHVDASPDRTHARIRFDVHEGPEVHVGQVIIRGNNRTDEWVIQQRLEFRSGDRFRPSRVRATQRRLGETGFFTGVTVTPVDPEVEAPVKDIVVQVIEVRPQYLELRGGFSTGEGIRAGMEYGYRDINLGPFSMTAALSVQLGYQIFIAPGDPQYAANFNSLPIGDRLRRRISLSFIVPAIRALGPYFRGSLDLATARVIERQFAIDTNSVSATLAYRPVRAYSVSITPEFQVNSLDALGNQTTIDSIAIITGSPDNPVTPADRERLVHLLLLPSGTTILGALRMSAAIDLRDQVFNTRSGFYASATAEILATNRITQSSSPISPGNTVHLTASMSGYVPLPFLDIVLASNLRAGLNISLDRDACRVTYTNRLFFMGGSDSMRGWLQDTMVPQDVIESYNGNASVTDPCTPTSPLFPASLRGHDDLIAATQRGGDVFVNWRNELRVPIGSTGFALAGFLDVGNLWKNLRNIDLVLRAAAGAGIRYITPIGPIALDLGFNLAPQTFEIPYAFHFSIGVF